MSILAGNDLCYTDDAMDDNTYQEHFLERADSWRQWLKTHHLDGILAIALDVLEPLGTVGAQFLYIGQPALNVLMPRNNLNHWAQLLESQDGMRWLREQLTELDTLDGK